MTRERLSNAPKAIPNNLWGKNPRVLVVTDKPETIQAFLCLLETLGRRILSTIIINLGA